MEKTKWSTFLRSGYRGQQAIQYGEDTKIKPTSIKSEEYKFEPSYQMHFTCSYKPCEFKTNDQLAFNCHVKENHMLYKSCENFYIYNYGTSNGINIHAFSTHDVCSNSLHMLFQCKMCICSALKLNSQELCKHLKSHHSACKVYICECKEYFLSKRELAQHLTHSHSKKTVTVKNLFKNKSVICETSSLYRCECEKYLLSSESLIRHLGKKHYRKAAKISNVISNDYIYYISHSQSDEVPYIFHCLFCSIKIVSATESHFKKHLFIELKYKSFSCDLCLKSFFIEDNVHKHFRLSHSCSKTSFSIKQDEQIESFVNRLINYQMMSNLPILENEELTNCLNMTNVCTCPFCSFQTSDAFSIQKHLYKHFQCFPYQCGHAACDKVYYDFRFLIVHNEKFHSGTTLSVILTSIKAVDEWIDDHLKSLIAEDQNFSCCFEDCKFNTSKVCSLSMHVLKAHYQAQIAISLE